MTFQPLFAELGRRIRSLRLARKVPAAALAETAGISRRYLTEAERGRANPSLAVLVRLAAALRTDLAGLVGGLEEALRRTERVALVGLRGAGKSSVGRRLALLLEAPFVELDRRVEALAGMELAEVFDLRGPEGFHALEAAALEEVLAEGERVVIATGGSIVDAPATFERLRATCRTVWLRAAPEEHFRRVVAQGDRRPMRERPRAMEELRVLLARRERDYGRCDLLVDTSGRDVDALAADLAAQLSGATPS